MCVLQDAISDVRKAIVQAVSKRNQDRKGVEAEILHHYELVYADGVIAGLETALAAMVGRYMACSSKGDCQDIPF